MRVAIVYPPFTQNGAYPLLTQNRQFKYTASSEVRIYPIIPASAATILKEAGHHVLFLDGMNQRLSLQEFNRRLLGFAPELVVCETKAPLLKRHWEFLGWLKSQLDVSTALVGDHVTFFPKESLAGGEVDYCLVGGDYDVSLAQLAAHIGGRGEMPVGVYWRDGETVKDSGPARLLEDLDSLPFIDRELTGWRNYGEAYLHHPLARTS